MRVLYQCCWSNLSLFNTDVQAPLGLALRSLREKGRVGEEGEEREERSIYIWRGIYIWGMYFMYCYLWVMSRWIEVDVWVGSLNTPPNNNTMTSTTHTIHNGHLLQQYIILADPTEFLGLRVG